MIPIPNLPTDSLYKFMFVGGLVMIISGYYLNHNLQNEVLEDLNKIHSSQIEYRLFTSLDSIRDKTSSRKFDREYNKISHSLKNNNLESAQKSTIKLDSLLEKDLQVMEKLISSRIKSAQDSVKLVEIGYSLNEVSKLYKYLMILGTIINFVGGICWYKKIQEPQDRMTKIQLEMMEIELEKAKNSNKLSSLKYPKSNPPFYKTRL